MRGALTLCLFCLPMMASDCPARATEQDFAYGPDPSQTLTVCAPIVGGALRPATLLIHGGSWRNGSRKALGDVCTLFATLGIVAATIDYRLNTDSPRTAWPKQFSDAQLALRWLRAHAAQWNIEPAHICAEGDSAGGQLALLLGAVPTIDPGDMQNILPAISPHANCVVAISGPSDLVEQAKIRPVQMHYLLPATSPDGFERQAVSASPALRLRHGVPTLLIHGADDGLVPFSQAIEMQRATVASGAPAWLIAHPGGHELVGLTEDQTRKIWPLIAAFVRKQRLVVPPAQMPIEKALQFVPDD